MNVLVCFAKKVRLSNSHTSNPLYATFQQDRGDLRAPNDSLFDAEEFGGLTSCIQMSTAVKKACAGGGLVDVIDFDGVTTTQTCQDPESILIKEALMASGVSTIFHFFPCQAEAICRMVHMQLRTVEIERENKIKKFTPPQSDIGMAAIVDLPTGVGKTIMTLVASLLVASGRGLDMEKACQLHREAYTWSNGGGVLSQDKLDALPAVGPGMKIVVFANTQLVSQWMLQCELAAKIVKSMAYANVHEWDVTIVKAGVHNTGSETLGDKEIRVYVCDTSDTKLKPKKFLRPSIYYAALICDEAAATTDNPLQSYLPVDTKFARLIMISADLSPWSGRRYGGFNPQKPSVFRSIFNGWKEIGYGGEQNIETTAALFATSVFSPDERSSVLEEFAEPMADRFLYVASIEYEPSLTESVGAGLHTDLGVANARDVFRSLYDIDITDCSTVEDLLNTIRKNACQLQAQQDVRHHDWRLSARIEKLEKLALNVTKLQEEECGICMEPMKKVSLIQPCLHFVCTVCIRKIMGDKCPFCRSKMIVGVHLEHAPEPGPCKKQKVLCPVEAPSSAAATGTAKGNMGEIFVDKIRFSDVSNTPVGVVQAVARTLETIKIARSASDDGHNTLCVMVICPGVEIRDGMFGDIGFGVTQYRTKGTRGNPHYKKAFEKEMKAFQEMDGKCKLLIVQDASNLDDGDTTDNMTGLDIDSLDAVVSVGRGNLAQRMGRLCRYSRTKPSAKKHALYVEIVPR